MSKQFKEIKERLSALAKKSDIPFFEKMLPGVKKIYGVKTPGLNILAKEYKEGSYDLARELWESGALEERIIAIKIMENTGKKDPALLLSLFMDFSAGIDNWAVCDGLGMQFLRGVVPTHSKEIFAISAKFSSSPDPWKRRLSLVMVEWYTRKKEFHPAIKKLLGQMENDEAYYVKKAAAWLKRNFEKGK